MSIHYNQVGYAPHLPKKAIITGKGENCMILSERGMDPSARKAMEEGKIAQPILSEPYFDEASGDTVRVADFSALTLPGKYYLFADSQSAIIEIKERPYRALSNALVKGLYYQRCGVELPETYAGPYGHPPCHLGKATLVKDDGELDPSTVIECAGGWHDAGDYGRYIAPAAVTVSHMLYAYELFPGAFKDELNIPESGNGVPDLLNEVRFELEWMLKMQRADGGLYHKVATRFFTGFIMPQDDQADLWLFRVTHTATGAHAACAAQASRVFRPFDAAFADRLLESAKKAWAWLEANPDFVPFTNPPNLNSGAYGDNNVEDELFWASAELYSVTGEGAYLEALKKRAPTVDISQLGWRETAGFGALCCLFVLKDKLDKDFLDSLRSRFIEGADGFLGLAQKSGYGTALDPGNYIWGSSLPILNNGIALICAHLLTGDLKYRDGALSQLDYILGLNATGYSFVTGFGAKPFMFPHHRPSYADGVDDPVPGLVSGGPNNRSPDGATKNAVPPGTPPAKFYLDFTPSASGNEIAIYWNSPAIFVAAYFDSL
ncbi:MAG: glycoside hydrolase family 9 protein [Treponema sp.]|nr:glycoside hydrolase family 9 protein [Treponema sp.]